MAVHSTAECNIKDAWGCFHFIPREYTSKLQTVVGLVRFVRPLYALLKKLNILNLVNTQVRVKTCPLIIVIAEVVCMRTKHYCINRSLESFFNDKGCRDQTAAL